MKFFCLFRTQFQIRDYQAYLNSKKVINKINKIEVRQSIFDMVCNTGNVYLITNSGERESFYFIEKPKLLKTQISQIF